MRPAKPLAVVVTLSLLSFAAAAGAQTKTDQYSYHFEDDFMVGTTLDTKSLVILERKPAPRITLLRPRASFVVEMLTSIETM